MNFTVRDYINKLGIDHSIGDRKDVGAGLYQLYFDETGQRPVKVEQVEDAPNGPWKLGVASYPEEWLAKKVKFIVQALILRRIDVRRKNGKSDLVYLTLLPKQTFKNIIAAGKKRGKTEKDITGYLMGIYIDKAKERAMVMEAPVKRRMRKRKRVK